MAVALLIVGLGFAWLLLRGDPGGTSTVRFPAHAVEPREQTSPLEDAGAPATVDGQARQAQPVVETSPAFPEQTLPSVRVRVVTHDGAPVQGVTVTGFSRGLDETFAIERTTADGFAQLQIDTGLVPPDDALEIGTALIGTMPPGVSFTPATIPAAEIRLVLEPEGSVEIVLSGGPAAVLEEKGRCTLSLDRERCESSKIARLHEDRQEQDTQARSIVFEHVALGMCWTAACSINGSRFKSVAFDGPRLPGERVRVELPFERVHVSVRARLLDEHGKPLADRKVEVHDIDKFGRASRFGGVTSDSDAFGRVSFFDWTHELITDGELAEWTTELGGLGTHRGRFVWPRSSLSSGGRPAVDMGDIVLTADPILAAGIVVDESGAGTAGRVSMRYTEPTGEEMAGLAAVETDEAGAFRMASPFPVDRLWLRADTRDGGRSEWTMVERGAREARLVAAQRMSKLSARVLCDEGISVDALEYRFVRIEPRDGTLVLVGGYETHDDGTIESNLVGPGRYRFTVSLGEVELASREVVTNPSASIAAFETVDLRKRLHVLRVKIPAGDPEALALGRAWVFDGERELSSATPTREGIVTIVSPSPTCSVRAFVPGYVERRFDGVADGAVLTLEPGLPTEFRVEGLPAADESPRFRLRLDRRDASDAARHFVDLDAHGRARFDLWGAGTYGVALVTSQSPYGPPWLESEIVRSPSPELATFTLTLDATRAKEKLERPK